MYRILSIDSSPELQERFIRFGIDYPRGFPYLLPKFYEKEAGLLQSDTNFFLKKGIFRGWVALDRDRIAGRIGAMKIPDMNLPEGTGLVGLYEAEPDYGVSRGLMDEAAGFLKQHSCSSIWGPIDFSIWHNYRFKTDCFEEAVFIGEPENPPHYPEQFMKYGFTVTHTWESQTIDRSGMQSLCDNNLRHWELLQKLGFTMKLANDKSFIAVFWDLISDIFKNFPAYTPLTQEQFEELYRELTYSIDTQASFCIRDPAGAYVGFGLVLKDLVAAVRAMQGKTGLLAKLKFMLHQAGGPTVNFYMTGFRRPVLNDAVQQAKEKYGETLSCGRAILHLGLRGMLENPKYTHSVFPLMRPDVPTSKWAKDIAIRKMHHSMYILNV